MKQKKSKKEMILILLFQFSLQNYTSGENWAILACGSSGYINYRHQADVFHVYQSLIKRGFSKEHIILFAYNDIAYNPKNPFPGEIYNRPDGPNVYEGVKIDYSNFNVNPKTYLSVLKGDTQNGKLKKVLNSTSNDNIFMYFSDHGIAGAIVFPNNQFLYADELEETFKFMKNKKMYKNIVFYLESCYSGSMFNNINSDLNVYSLTAANPSEESLATYCYPQDVVKGKEMHTCLSNEFTSNWLDDSDSRINFNEILSKSDNNINDNLNENYSNHEQYIYVKKMTKNSHVQEYGNLSIGDLPITYFQSSSDTDIDYDKKKEREKSKEVKEYEEIKKRIADLDLDDDDFNYIKNENNVLEDEEIDNLPLNLFEQYNLEEKYNYISYIINRNENINESRSNLNRNKKTEISEPLRVRNKKRKRIKDRKYNLVSSKVKLFYLELGINQSNDDNNVLDFRNEIAELEKTKNLFGLLKLKLNIPDKFDLNNIKIDYKCLRFSIQIFQKECGINERDLEYISLFSFECSKKNVDIVNIKSSLIELCSDKKNGLLDAM